MKSFLKPNIFKMTVTIALIAVAFGGQLIYSMNLSLDGNGNIVEPNLVVRSVGLISEAIDYIPRLVGNFLITPLAREIYLNPTANFLAGLLFVVLLTLETYIVGCFVSLFVKK